MPHTEERIEKIINRLAESTHSPKGEYSAGKSIRILERRIAAGRRRRFLRIASVAAAVVCLCIYSWSIYNGTTTEEIQTISTLAETRTVRLPDGTEVVLNHYSSLSYPGKGKKKIREVILSGEAYFSVTKDAKRPFIVCTGSVNVEVLGTQFNVEAYPGDEQVKTSLFEGAVAVSDESGHNRLTLTPNESATYHKAEGKLSKTVPLRIADDIAWKNGEFVFNNLSLKEITRELSNSFGVKIKIGDGQLQEYKMNAHFTNGESLEEMLDLLQEAGSFRYTRNDSIIIINKILSE